MREGWSKWNAECLQHYCQVCAILGAKRHCLRNICHLRAGGDEGMDWTNIEGSRAKGEECNFTCDSLFSEILLKVFPSFSRGSPFESNTLTWPLVNRVYVSVGIIECF